MKVFKAAIYHFSYGKPGNPYIRKDNELLLKFARTIGYVDVDTYYDYRTTRDEHTELDRLLSQIDEYDALFVMNYYNLNRNTLMALGIIKRLSDKGIKVYSVNESTYVFEDTADFNHPLNAVTYYCHWGAHPDEESTLIRNETLKMFVEKKTFWNLVGQFSDEMSRGHVGWQEQFENLMNEKDRFDIILVPSFRSLNWQTSYFCRFKEKLQKDIYALQGGLLRKEHIV